MALWRPWGFGGWSGDQSSGLGVGRYDPFGNFDRGNLASRAIRDFRRDMDRMMNDFFSDYGNFGSDQGRSDNPTGDGDALVNFSPAVDVREEGNELVVHSDLPGVPKENVNVEIRGNNLIISGESNREENRPTEYGRIRERSYGRFLRTVPLGEAVDPEKVKCRLDQGVLEVRLPRVQTGKRITLE
ncbi:hypothetical protein G9A89_003793 [Geosiphon pyriformis]|nr:hypothetical protein G9A89_003793 [Geosiphon pyriformis]